MRRAACILPVAAACAALALPASAAVHLVRDGESIQAAVEAASRGDTILVRPGTYTATPGSKSVVDVQTDDLTLIGSLGAVIDASDVEYGIRVGPDIDPRRDGCPAKAAVSRFRIRGFTVANARDTGLRLAGVEHYRISHGFYANNAKYGPFPVCSRHGRIDHNVAFGHDDAAIYVGDDDTVLVDHNIVLDSSIGVKIENSVNAVVRHNWLTDNTAGVLVIVLPGLPMPFTENVFIEHNWIANNNRPNQGSGQIGRLLPVGTGILNIGGDDVVIRKNMVIDNDSLGIASIANFFSAFDPRIEPFADGYVVKRNIVKGNGTSPDPLRLLTPPADIIYLPDLIDPDTREIVAEDPDPTDNCFAGNHFDTEFPPGITSLFPCP